MQLIPLTATITVPYTPVIDSIDEGADTNGLFANVDYLLAWGDRFTFMNEVMGLSQSQGGTSGAWVQQLPFQYPPSPNLWATGCRSRGEGPIKTGTSNASYTNAVVSVNFRKPPISFQASDDPNGYNGFATTSQESQYLFWASQEIDSAVEYLPVPNTNLKWASDSTSVSQPVSRRVNCMVMSIVYERFPTLPFNILQGYVDTVNFNTWMNCPPGTVMFCPPKTRREPNPDGSITQKLALSFKYRQYEWNMMLKSAGQGSASWDYVVDPTNSNAKLFQYADFLKLLQWLPATYSNVKGT